MANLISYNPSKDLPVPRTGARGFNTVDGAVMFDPNILTPISDEMLTELNRNPTFSALKKSGAITVTTATETPDLPVPVVVPVVAGATTPAVVPAVVPGVVVEGFTGDASAAKRSK